MTPGERWRSVTGMERFMFDDCVVADGPGNDFGAWVPKTPGESGDASVDAAPRGLVSQVHGPRAEDDPA